jgi:hypothetical protein
MEEGMTQPKWLCLNCGETFQQAYTFTEMIDDVECVCHHVEGDYDGEQIVGVGVCGPMEEVKNG